MVGQLRPKEALRWNQGAGTLEMVYRHDVVEAYRLAVEREVPTFEGLWPDPRKRRQTAM